MVGDYDCDGVIGIVVVLCGLCLFGVMWVIYVIFNCFVYGYGLSVVLVEFL